MSNGKTTQDVKCELHQFERNRYFYGKLLTVRDFEVEQRYAREHRHLHNQSLHGSGVVCGLTVVAKAGAPTKVIVSPGLALDCCGREIVVAEPQEVDLTNLTSNLEGTAQTVYLCIKYDECMRAPVPVTANVSTCEEVCDYGRIQENFAFGVLNTLPDAGQSKVCETWLNMTQVHGEITEGAQPIAEFERIAPRWVRPGEVFEVHRKIKPVTSNKSLRVADVLPGGFTLLDGSLQMVVANMVEGKLVYSTYLVKVDHGIQPEMKYEIATRSATFSLEGEVPDRVPNGTYLVTFRLYIAKTGGDQLWEETQSVVVSNRRFNVTLRIPFNLPFAERYWLKIAVNLNGEIIELPERIELSFALSGLPSSKIEVISGTTAIDEKIQQELSNQMFEKCPGCADDSNNGCVVLARLNLQPQASSFVVNTIDDVTFDAANGRYRRLIYPTSLIAELLQCLKNDPRLINVTNLLGELADPQKVAVLDEGHVVAARPQLNFVGPGVAVSDNPANNRVDINVSGTGQVKVSTGVVIFENMMPTEYRQSTPIAHGLDVGLVAIVMGREFVFMETGLEFIGDSETSPDPFPFRFRFPFPWMEASYNPNNTKRTFTISIRDRRTSGVAESYRVRWWAIPTTMEMPDIPVPRPLDVGGLQLNREYLLTWIVMHPGIPVEELASKLQVEPGEIKSELQRLQETGQIRIEQGKIFLRT